MNDLLTLFLLQLALILVATRAGSYLAIKVGLVPVLGEMLAGIALGPSLFGALFPAAQTALFPAPQHPGHSPLQLMSWLGLILLMFIGGLDIDLPGLRKNLHRSAVIALFTLAGSLAAGFALAGSMLTRPGMQRPAFELFVAVALAITAIPVLIKILADLGLKETPAGQAVVVAGVILDTVGWILLALVIRGVDSGYSLAGVFQSLGLVLVFLLLTLTLGRVLLIRLVRLQGREDDLSVNFLASVLALMLLGSVATHLLEVHAVLGAFVVGLMVGTWPLSSRLKDKFQDFAFAFFVPIFLANLGISANLRLLDTPAKWGLTLLITLAIVLAKIIGGALGARLVGFRRLEPLAVGMATIPSGAMGLVAAKVGTDLGIVPPDIFAMLVVVAVLRTVLAALGLQLLQGVIRGEEPQVTQER